MAVTYQDLMRIIPEGVDYWVNPEYQDASNLLSGLYRHYQPKNVPMGEVYARAPNAGALAKGFLPQLGVRAFAQEHGLEDLLNWDQDSQQVTLGGINVPYTFGLQGRTYANSEDLYKVLEQVKTLQRARAAANTRAKGATRSVLDKQPTPTAAPTWLANLPSFWQQSNK